MSQYPNFVEYKLFPFQSAIASATARFERLRGDSVGDCVEGAISAAGSSTEMRIGCVLGTSGKELNLICIGPDKRLHEIQKFLNIYVCRRARFMDINTDKSQTGNKSISNRYVY